MDMIYVELEFFTTLHENMRAALKIALMAGNAIMLHPASPDELKFDLETWSLIGKLNQDEIKIVKIFSELRMNQFDVQN